MKNTKDIALTLMQLLENTGTVFEDFDLALSIIEETLHRTSPKRNRPVVVHQHTKGDWLIGKWGEKIHNNNKTICFFIRQGGTLTEQNRHDARLISQAPKLLQIAEMFFDFMSNNIDKFKHSLPYSVTADTLNEINPNNK